MEFKEKFKQSAKDYIMKFFNDQQYIANIETLRDLSFLKNVKISDGVKEFEQYKESKSINKQGFFNGMR